MQKKNLEERLELFEQTVPIENLKLIDILNNGFSYYKSKTNNTIYYSVKEYCIRLDIPYDSSKFYDLKYPDVLIAYIDNNNTIVNIPVLLISLSGMEKYINSSNYCKKNRIETKKEIFEEVSNFEKLINKVSDLKDDSENTKEEENVEETKENNNDIFEIYKEPEINNNIPKPTNDISGFDLINAGINKIVQEKLKDVNTGFRKESASSLENFIKNGINEEMQKKIINTAVHIHCNKLKNITHENVFSDLYTRFGDYVGRNFVSIKNSFIKENKSILDIIVTDLKLGIQLIDFYYTKFDYKDIQWSISDCFHCYHDKNLVKLYLNCILQNNINYI